jgi:hypothetical protein
LIDFNNWLNIIDDMSDNWYLNYNNTTDNLYYISKYKNKKMYFYETISDYFKNQTIDIIDLDLGYSNKDLFKINKDYFIFLCKCNLNTDILNNLLHSEKVRNFTLEFNYHNTKHLLQ